MLKIKELTMKRKIEELKEILKELTTLYYKAEKLNPDCASIISTAEDVVTDTIKFYNKENVTLLSKKDFDVNFKILLDFMLDYGHDGSLPNMDEDDGTGKPCSGLAAYLAAVRLAGAEVEPHPILSHAEVYTGDGTSYWRKED